jgi:hypothetical protein
MKKHILRSAMTFTAGVLTMMAVAWLMPQQPAQAPVANGNDKFSMVTVPVIEGDETEAVFVLNHLTGVLTGAYINVQTQKFSQRFLHNVAGDFAAGGAVDPKYAIVSAYAPMRPAGGVQPSSGLLYIGELSTGAVIAYGFPRPTTRNMGGTLEVVKLDFFKFADSVGQ